MAINVNSNINRISPMKTMTWARAKAEDAGAGAADSSTDKPGVSQGELPPMEKALQSITKEEITGWMKEWESQHPLEINGHATVDPDGSAYVKAYYSSMTTQLAAIGKGETVPQEDIQANAKSYALSVLDEMVAEYKKTHGILF